MSDLAGWIEAALGHAPGKLDLYARALTHPSHGADHYERLEFLGDRVLGLVVAEWLLETYPTEAEGKLSDRLNGLVNGVVCAEVARELGVASRLRLGKQAQDDGVFESEYVLGDVTEALIGALFLDAGLGAARDFIRTRWGDRVDRCAAPPKHPKAALQEWAAANRRKPPVYEVIETSGPDHAPRFRVKVSVRGVGEAEGAGTSKQEAETAAADAMMDTLK